MKNKTADYRSIPGERDEAEYWERFASTGSIADYLSYTACTGEMYHDGNNDGYGNSTEFDDDRGV